MKRRRVGAIIAAAVAMLVSCARSDIQDFTVYIWKRRTIEWRGLRVAVDSNYVVGKRDGGVIVMRYSDAPPGWFRRLRFEWFPDGDRRFESLERNCADAVPDCSIYRHVPDSAVMRCLRIGSSGEAIEAFIFHCSKEGTGVTAKFACLDGECVELLQVAHSAFATFSPPSK